MRQRALSRQGGFGALVFVLALSVVAFSIVLGRYGMLVRQQADTLEPSQRSYIAESLSRVASAWQLQAYEIDNVDALNATTAQDILALSGVQPRYGAKVALSRVFLDPVSNTSYRNFVMYLPTPDDEAAPLDVASFELTGAVPACASGVCPERLLGTFSSLVLERELTAQTAARLNRIASKAQAYFKARMLQDPERNVSVNYFRKPSGDCVVLEVDLGCFDSYTPLSSLDGYGSTGMTGMALNLGLGSQELLNAWGQPMEASNLDDSETADAPFTMAFRSRTPSGEYLKILAVQPL